MKSSVWPNAKYHRKNIKRQAGTRMILPAYEGTELQFALTTVDLLIVSVLLPEGTRKIYKKIKISYFIVNSNQSETNMQISWL